jgi:putative pyruvate formate lyase activating enzyme
VLEQPSYLRLYKTGELEERRKSAIEMLKSCKLCPHLCGINRAQGEKGFCRAGETVIVASIGPHFGEEDVLVGEHGSGAIFFGFCNVRCVFCQNYELSHYGEGREVSIEELANAMLRLQNMGCHNINFVSPTHFAAHIIQAVEIAANQGLHIPLVYNSGGFDTVETLALLEGIIDIYMPDIKFIDEETASKYLRVKGYPEAVKRAIREMYRQVGDLRINRYSIAYRGLLVRHLVMPDGLAGTAEIMHFLAKEISPHTFVNIMGQYYPSHMAGKFPELNRRITNEELAEAVRIAKQAGLYRFK